MTVFEALKESNHSKLTEREILENLQEKCGLKLSEALEVCKTEYPENKRFKEAAFDIKVESLPLSGYINDEGVTVVTDDWEE